ncbi:hypothetical protein [Beijerinckia sp. L45]|uniref:hypothetical protein n=1 Tax=Beijerinckia sp. L45 TaxID=1641855 RepID=UPI001AEE6492|nr:hypothetical protein [Beijerinckia sp. L45]
MAEVGTYRDRRGNDPEKGAALQISTRQGEVLLDLGAMRGAGSAMSPGTWAALSPEEAREVAADLCRAAFHAERRQRAMAAEAVASRVTTMAGVGDV